MCNTLVILTAFLRSLICQICVPGLYVFQRFLPVPLHRHDIIWSLTLQPHLSPLHERLLESEL